MAIDFNYNSSTLHDGLGNLSRIGAAVMMYAQTKSVELEATMKRNRPWTDRTGMAKARLNATVSQPDADTIRITLAHGVEYGIDLELAHNKNYAIIAPTIRQEGPRVVSGLRNIMSQIT